MDSVIIKIFGQEVTDYAIDETYKCTCSIEMEWPLAICLIVFMICITIALIYWIKKLIHDSDLKSYEKYRDLLNKQK